MDPDSARPPSGVNAPGIGHVPEGRRKQAREKQTSNLRVGGSNPSERAKDFNDLGKHDAGRASQKYGLGSTWEAPARF
jgi:hypothetical protein